MKSNGILKSYRTGFIFNILISAFIACLAESFFVLDGGKLLAFFTGNSEYGQKLENYDAVFVVECLLAGIIIFSIIFYFLEKKRIDYMEKIMKGIDEIAEGNFSYEIEVSGNDEFAGMAFNINKMAADLKLLLEKERSAESSKNDLVTNITHDLKTPLTSVIGYLELLTGQNVPMITDSGQREKYLKIAYKKAKRLEQLIEELLVFTKMSYAKITMKPEYLDIVKLLGQLLEESYPQFAEKGLSYEMVSDVKELEIMADGDLLARLFDNLISNAIKYGCDGKRIIVKLASDPDARIVTVKVINFGYVIPEKELSLIFNKFYRVDRARSTNTGGRGLGLAIARDIVNAHGGSISVSSDLSGTVFTVKLRMDFDRTKEQLGF